VTLFSYLKVSNGSKTLTWKYVNITRKGNNTIEKDSDKAKICQQFDLRAKEKLKFLLTKVEYENAQLICRKLGGKLPLPTKEKDFSETIGNEYLSEPLHRLSCKKLWLPIVQVNFRLVLFLNNKIFFTIYFSNINIFGLKILR
jgi:hypothetical protein